MTPLRPLLTLPVSSDPFNPAALLAQWAAKRQSRDVRFHPKLTFKQDVTGPRFI
jgi:hypothetical protein